MKKVKLSKSIEESQPEENDIRALLNPLILSEIVSYLTIQELKLARLVNNFWIQQSDKHFYRNGAIYLVKGKNLTNPYSLALRSHKNWKLFLYFGSVRRKDIRRRMTKLLDFASFHTEFAILGNAKKLSDYKSIFGLNKQLNLELKVGIFMGVDLAKFSSVLTENIVILPLLLVTKLQLYFDDWVFPEDLTKEIIRQFARKLLQLMPNICELELENFGDYEASNYKIYLEEMIKLQSESIQTLPFKNLEILSINKWTCKVTKLCLSMKQPIRVLKAINLTLDKNDCLKSLEKLLGKNSNTLESLEFSYETKQEDFGGLNFPNLPKLKRLAISVILTEGGNAKDVLGFRKLFSIGSTRFIGKFPKLHTLELNLGSLSATEAFRTFFPILETTNVELVFKQITSFKFPLHCEDWNQVGNFHGILKSMFPNA